MGQVNNNYLNEKRARQLLLQNSDVWKLENVIRMTSYRTFPGNALNKEQESKS